MKIKTLFLTLLLGGLAANSPAAENSFFNMNDFSVDGFGFYGSHDKGGADRDAWGLGIGANYFFNKYFGVGADSYADAFESPYLINFSGFARYPISDIIAPYAFTGFGRQWDHAAQWTGHIGLGAEAPLPLLKLFQKQTAVFVDWRHVLADRTRDYEVVRFGFRLHF